MAIFCDMCGTPLTDPQSQRLGVGPDCAKKYAVQSGAIESVKRIFDSGYQHPALANELRQLAQVEPNRNNGPRAARLYRGLRERVAGWHVRATQWESTEAAIGTGWRAIENREGQHV